MGLLSAVTAVALGGVAQAVVIRGTITGAVAASLGPQIDVGGFFGPAGADLAGAAVTLTFSYDPATGHYQSFNAQNLLASGELSNDYLNETLSVTIHSQQQVSTDTPAYPYADVYINGNGIGTNFELNTTNSKGGFIELSLYSSTPWTPGLPCGITTLTPGYNRLCDPVAINTIINSLTQGNITLLNVEFGVEESLALSFVPVTSLSSSSLTFQAGVGGANPASQTVSISNAGSGTLNWTATASPNGGGNWLSVSPPSGTNSGSLTVSVSTAGLAAGTYGGSILVAAAGAGNSPLSIAVTLTIVTPAGVPVLTSLSPSGAKAGGAAFTLTVNGSGFVMGMTSLMGPVPEAVLWNGTALSTTFVSATQLTAAIPAGDIASAGASQITVVNPSGFASNALAFTINSATPQITVTNDASFATQISPGSLVALFGNGNVLATATVSGFSLPLPTSSNGTSVTINGFPCPLVYVSPSQINLQAPMELQPGTAPVVVNNNGQAFSTTVQVLAAAPGIFTTDYYANGGVGILQDSATGTVLNANNPAAPSQNVTMYFTGVGPVTNSPGTGMAAPGSPSLSQSASTVSVSVNGISVQPSFTGLTPGFAGLGQVNFQLPANTPGGNSIPVVLTINGVSAKTVHISGSGSTPAQLTLLDAITSNQTGTPDSVCTAPPLITTFQTTDPGVYLFFDVDGAVVGDVATANFYRPDGVSYFTSTSTVTAVGANGYVCFGSEMYLAGYPGASYPGVWTVDASWNNAAGDLAHATRVLAKPLAATAGAQLFSRSFSVNNPPPQQQFTLTIASAGTGFGTVSPPTPLGTPCGTNCWGYAPGTVVTLTAPPKPGSTFVGWSGASCSGTGICTVTMNSNQTVTAVFNLTNNPPSLTIVPGQVISGVIDQNNGAYSNLTPYLLIATGGNVLSGYTWTVPPGSPRNYPPAITIQPFGVLDDVQPQSLSGGRFAVPVEVSDGTNTVTGQVTVDLSAVCNSSNGNSSQPCFTTPVTNQHIQYLPPGKVGSPYAATIATEGGTPPYTWVLGLGSLPPGIVIDQARGVLRGTPTAAAGYSFSVLTTDSAGMNTSREIQNGVLAAQFNLTVAP
jgi:uncharacterized protein (TIGR03437 family)